MSEYIAQVDMVPLGVGSRVRILQGWPRPEEGKGQNTNVKRLKTHSLKGLEG